MSKGFGFDLLQHQVLEHVNAELVWTTNDRRVGDSEIEKIFFLALHFRVRFGFTEYHTVCLASDYAHEQRFMDERLDQQSIIILRPQAVIGDYRVDFLIHAAALAQDGNIGRWRRLVVECDGHDFHERTKEQAAKDRSRDRWLTSNDYDVFRFTGSELWRDPMGCAEQVTDWAVKGWFE